MSHEQKKPGEKKVSRLAFGITIIVLLCLLLAGGAVLMFLQPAQTVRSVPYDASPGNFSGRLYNWLGIDTVKSILLGDEAQEPDNTIAPDVSADASTADTSPADLKAGTLSESSADRNTQKTEDSGAGAGESAKTAKSPASSAGSKSAETPAESETSAGSKSAENPAESETSAGSKSAENTESGSGKTDRKDSGSGKTDQKDAGSGKTDQKDAGSGKTVQKDSEKEERDTSPTKLQKKYIKAWEEWHMRDFAQNFPLHNYNWKYLSYDDDGILQYKGDENYTIRRGIDVSEFQGKIDWDKVKKAGYDFVFVRVGHRTMHTGSLEKDTRAIKNLKRAKKAGLDVGAYLFSQAITEEEAREEAELCLEVVKESGVALTLPIVFDPEIVIEDYNARINYISGKQFTDDAVAFCETIKKAGYTPAIYANCSTETDILDMSRLKDKDIVIWYADYSSTPETPYDFTFWQYSNLGWVDGIPETETDLNLWFIKK